jgi:hypothetical protein
MIQHTQVEDLGALADLPTIEFVDADLSSVSKLPRTALPSLRKLDLLGAPVSEKLVADFQKLNPQCEVRHDWEAVLQKALSGADRVRVIPPKEGRPVDPGRVLAEERDAKAVSELSASFVVDDSTEPFHCMCSGSPWLEFYRGDQLLATIPVQHGFGIRWEGWPADRVLIPHGQDTLSNWLARRGVKGPKMELAQKRERERAESHRLEVVQAIAPAAVVDDLKKARSVDDAVSAFTKNLSDAAQRAEICLRLFGADFGSWSKADPIDDLLKGRLLPGVPEEVMASVKLEPHMQASNGLGRWLFFERKWSNWKPDDLEKVLTVVGRDGLTHPRDVNRRKTIIALGEIHTESAKKLLRAVLRGELSPRPLPEGSEVEAGGMVTYTPEPKGLPQNCSDAAHAAIWLARLEDDETKPDVQKLLGALQGEERAALRQALHGKGQDPDPNTPPARP